MMNKEGIELIDEVKLGLGQIKEAARRLPSVSRETINAILKDLADTTVARIPEILSENRKDLDRMDPNDPKYDRLLLDQSRIEAIAEDIRNVSEMDSPIDIILEQRTLHNGLELKKVSVPMGIIGIVFESRPNVTFDVFSLCFKSGNAVVLKGSRDAHFSNIIIVDIIRQVLARHGLPQIVFLAPSDRMALRPILEAEGIIDLIIPRGSQGLIDYVRSTAKVPVIETGAGIVHTYVDVSADIEKAKAITINAKTRRVSVCNALDCLIVHKDVAQHLPYILEGADEKHDLILHADSRSFNMLSAKYRKDLLRHATEQSYGTEFLSMQLSIKVVDNIDDALDHIYQNSSKHSEAIVAEDPAAIERFYNEVDAASIYANASTAFTDGAQFGLGAEIGISTQKLHARGPMALKELTSYKWIVKGDGQIRA